MFFFMCQPLILILIVLTVIFMIRTKKGSAEAK